MHFLDDLSILSQDGQSKGIDLIDESGEDSHSSVLFQDSQRSIDLIDESGEDRVLSQDGQSINLDGLGEDGPFSSFQSTFF